jgi:hypothetical protein
MKHKAFPARIRMNQSEFLSIIILDARFSNAPTWPLVIYDSICVDNHESIIPILALGLDFCVIP